MGKRAPGEGTISPRPDGRWMGQLSITLDGKRIRKTVYGDSPKEVAALLDTVRAGLRAGLDAAAPDSPLHVYLPLWLAQQSLRPSTQRLYTHMITAYLVPHLGHVRLSKLTAPQIRTMLAQMEKAEVGARTRQATYQVLRTALDQAVKDGLVLFNAAARVARPAAPPQAQAVLTAAEARTVLTGTASTPYGPLWALLLGTGLRRGEALALRWADVDVQAGWLTVVASLDARTQARQAPKTVAGTRTVPLAPFVVAALQQRHAAQVVQRAHARFSGQPWARERDTTATRLVFTTDAGGPLWAGQVDKHWRAALESVGLPHIPIHSLRRSYATLLRSVGVDVALIGTLLGHSTGNVTLRYAQATAAMQQEAVARLADLLAVEQTQEEHG